MMRNFLRFLILASCLLLTSCGYTQTKDSYLEFRKNGNVLAVYTAAFPKETYDFDSLDEETRDAADAYNETAGKNRIRVKAVSEKDGTAYVALLYKSPEDGTAFNRRLMYRDSLENALLYSVAPPDVIVYASEGGYASSLGVLSEDKTASYTLVIVEDSIRVIAPGRAVYYSENVKADEEGNLYVNPDLPDGSLPEKGYIIYQS